MMRMMRMMTKMDDARNVSPKTGSGL